jgi:hypothetical protein
MIAELVVFILFLFVNTHRNIKFEEYKNNIKKSIISLETICDYPEKLKIFRSISNTDNPDAFFCNKYEINIYSLPMYGQVDKNPWSGHYWPIKYGGMSVRYTDGENNTMYEYKKIYTWKESVNKYHQPEEHLKLFNGTDFQKYVNENYSPSEKYDLLVGDYDYTLTNKLKDEGNLVEKNKDGDVPVWMGYCHGWTPASFIEKEPIKPVKIMATDNSTEITFLPDDIKALISLYYASEKIKTKFIGNLCKYKNKNLIPKDKLTGLWEDYSCFGINPASFYLTFANQIGLRNKNLIFDPDTRGEVWNQPVIRYEGSYVHLLNKTEVSYIDAAIVDIASLDHVEDNMIKFLLSNKAEGCKYFLQVKFYVYYLFESMPVHKETINSDITDNTLFVKYDFVLELDRDKNVIGGEWLSNNHPIFIWTSDSQSITLDKTIRFDGSVGELNNLTADAKIYSKQTRVMKSVIKYLIKNSTN